MKKNLIIAGCIVSNLIAGNSCLYIGVDGVNYLLMVCMSVVCTLSYLVLFKAVPFTHWSRVVQCLVSILICFLIIILGNTAGFMFMASYGDGYLFLEIMKNLSISIVCSVMGAILFSGFALGFGLVNMLWLVLYSKCK